MNTNETISTFAFKTGKEIEKLIKEQTGNLEVKNRTMEGKILQWYMETKDEKFAIHFGITEMREGNTMPDKILKTTDREIGHFIEELSRISRNVKLIKQGKTHTKEGVNRLDIINICANDINIRCCKMQY